MMITFFKLRHSLKHTPIVRYFSLSNKAARPQGASADDVDHIPPEEFKKMQDSLKKFAQCMSLGKYQAA